VESEEHYGGVRQVREEVIVSTCCNGRVQEGSGPLSSGGLHPVVVTQLEGRAHNIRWSLDQAVSDI